MIAENVLEKKVRRLDYGAARYYYHTDDPKTFYKSVTTFAKEILPPSTPLEDWKINIALALGKDEGKQYLQLTATYGSVLDGLVELLLKGETITKELIRSSIITEMKGDKFLTSYELVQVWENQLVKDVLAIRQWVKDVNFEPVLIQEMVLVDGILGGQVDFLGVVDVEEKGFFGEVYKTGEQKGKPKESKQTSRKLALVDLKSGKDFYDAHEFQLVAYAKGIEQIYGVKVEKLYNIAPKKWTGDSPTYLLKDQTDTKMWELYDDYVSIGRKKGMFSVSPKFLTVDTISLGDSPFKYQTLEELLSDEGSN